MALHIPRAPGFQSMMKDGSKFFSGVEEAVVRNIGEPSHPTPRLCNYILRSTPAMIDFSPNMFYFLLL